MTIHSSDRRTNTPLLICLAILFIYLSFFVVRFDALAVYLVFISEYAQKSDGFRLLAQFLVAALLYSLAAALLFDIVFGAATLYPGDNQGAALIADLLARCTIALSPNLALLFFFTQLSGSWNWVI